MPDNDRVPIDSLTQAPELNSSDTMPVVHSVNGVKSTYKTPLTMLANFINKVLQYTSDLHTNNKTIIGAINELEAGGGGGSSTFEGLSDVDIDSQTLANGQVPVYNSTSRKWENGNASGGSGGHTILDDGGNALTQRSNMQFKGAYSEDNSTDSVTEVNIVRSMTKAEFDLLTDDKKQGIINITDITSGSDDRFQPVIHSTAEREIGVWIDGKPLYEKVFTMNQITVSSSWTNTAIDTTDIDIIANAFGIAPDGTFYSGLDGDPTASSHTVLKLRNYATSYIVKLILQYTKISDTAGSGAWTPQGVPTVHYSEDEQVVGTWVDGSTIYEKTFNLQSEISIDTSNWTSLGVSLSGVDTPISIEARSSRAINSSVVVDVFDSPMTAKGLDKIKSLTIRYTKSSS